MKNNAMIIWVIRIIKAILIALSLFVIYQVHGHHLSAFFKTGYTSNNIYVYWVVNNEQREVYCYVKGRNYFNDFYVPAKYYEDGEWYSGYSRQYRAPPVNTQYHCE